MNLQTIFRVPIRSRYTNEFKAYLLEQSAESDMSIRSVSRLFGVNRRTVQKWMAARSWEARPSCRHDEFLCASGDRCLARSWVCDRVLDCGDGSDERHCHHRAPSSSLRRVGQRRLIQGPNHSPHSPVSACTISSACIDIVHDRHCWQLRADSC